MKFAPKPFLTHLAVGSLCLVPNLMLNPAWSEPTSLALASPSEITEEPNLATEQAQLAQEAKQAGMTVEQYQVAKQSGFALNADDIAPTGEVYSCAVGQEETEPLSYEQALALIQQLREQNQGINRKLNLSRPILVSDLQRIYVEHPSLRQLLRGYYNKLFKSSFQEQEQRFQLPPLLYKNQEKGGHPTSYYQAKGLNQGSWTLANGDFVTEVTGLGNTDLLKQKDSNLYGAVAANVYAAIASINPVNADGSLRHEFSVRNLITKAVQAYGFYQTEVEVTRYNSNNRVLSLYTDPATKFKIKVNLGSYAKMTGNSQVTIRGQGTGLTAYQQLSELFIAPNQVYDTEKYESTKDKITDIAKTYGYFDGKFISKQVYIDPELQQATWVLDYDTCRRYKIGEIKLSGGLIDHELVSNALEFKTGSYYSENQVTSGITSLQSSKYFDSVSVDTKINSDSKTVDLSYELVEGKPNSLDLSLGYDTDEGVRTKITYDRNYLNRWGGWINSNLYLSKYTQKLDLNYKHPYFYDPLYKTFNFGVEVAREYQSEGNYYSKSTVLSANYSRLPTNSWQFATTLYTRKDLWLENGTKQNIDLSYIEFTLARKSLNTDFYLGLRTSWLSERLLHQQVKYNQFDLRFSHLFDLTKTDSLLAGLRIGKLYTNSFYKLAPSLRFYSGGAASVRGYSYNSISSYKGVSGAGGTSKTEFTLEYLHEMIPNLRSAVFIDGGNSTDHISFKDLSYGAGVGVRYFLPVGYAKFDIAYPLGVKFNWKKLAFYLGIQTSF